MAAITLPTSPLSTHIPPASGPGDDKIIFDGITFDDVLLVPRRSAIMPADADTSTRLTRTIGLIIYCRFSGNGFAQFTEKTFLGLLQALIKTFLFFFRKQT